jgi:translation initiation factor 2B subunit (eIF-2B alpha/beta/delta family)
MKPTFYETVVGIVKSTPNNMSLGDSIRSLVNKIESTTEQTNKGATNQLTIFDEIKERQDEHRS